MQIRGEKSHQIQLDLTAFRSEFYQYKTYLVCAGANVPDALLTKTRVEFDI